MKCIDIVDGTTDLEQSLCMWRCLLVRHRMCIYYMLKYCYPLVLPVKTRLGKQVSHILRVTRCKSKFMLLGEGGCIPKEKMCRKTVTRQRLRTAAIPSIDVRLPFTSLLFFSTPSLAEEFLSQLMPIFESLRQHEDLPCCYPIAMGHPRQQTTFSVNAILQVCFFSTVVSPI